MITFKLKSRSPMSSCSGVKHMTWGPELAHPGLLSSLQATGGREGRQGDGGGQEIHAVRYVWLKPSTNRKKTAGGRIMKLR